MPPLIPPSHDYDHDAPPLNPLPPAVWLLALAIFGIEAVLGLGRIGVVGGPAASGWRLDLVREFAFSAPQLRWMLAHHILRWDFVLRLVSYAFVHTSFTHALFVGVFVLALGKMVGDVLSSWAVLAVFFGASVLGALAYAALWDANVPLAGGFPGAYGLVGAFTYILYAGLGPREVGRLRAFSLIAFLLGLQLVFGVGSWLFGSHDMSSWDWPARLAGFAAGFGLAFLMAPGGWQRTLGRLRQR